MTSTAEPATSRNMWIEARAADDGFGPDPDPERHGVKVDGQRPATGDRVTTLVGEDVVVTPPVPGRPAPECRACDRAWRAAEGIAQRDEHPPAYHQVRDRLRRQEHA